MTVARVPGGAVAAAGPAVVVYLPLDSGRLGNPSYQCVWFGVKGASFCPLLLTVSMCRGCGGGVVSDAGAAAPVVGTARLAGGARGSGVDRLPWL